MIRTVRLFVAAYQPMLAAINAGVDLIGYSPWSAIDLISVHEGIRKRYGFIYVDRNDAQEKEQKRVRKDSFYWYQKLIEEGRSLRWRSNDDKCFYLLETRLMPPLNKLANLRFIRAIMQAGIITVPLRSSDRSFDHQ